MNEEKLQFEDFAAAACRQRAEDAFQAAAESVLSDGRPTRSESDEVRINFDWILHVQDARITFQVRLERRSQKSAIDFGIDLSRLSVLELEHLNGFLARRHTGITTPYEIARNLSWLLELSLAQTTLQLNLGERQLKVRELLLFSPRE